MTTRKNAVLLNAVSHRPLPTATTSSASSPAPAQQHATDNNTRDGAYLTEAETADLLRISSRTLQRWRVEGCGPTFCKLGRRVVYARSSVLVFAHAHERGSTSEAKASDGQ